MSGTTGTGISVNLSKQYPCVLECGGETVLLKFKKRKDEDTITISITADKKVVIAFPSTVERLKTRIAELEMEKRRGEW